jgi:hypothetical protein
MKDYPNIFHYATKELTQDAIICWLLECLSSSDSSVRETGKEFLRQFVFKNKISINEAELIECSKQYHKMDVYARVLINKKDIYPIIFENKTNSFLHGNQLERYCNTVYGWFWDKPNKAKKDQEKDIRNHKKIDEASVDFSNLKICNIQYILFKSSMIFDWEEAEFEIRSRNLCNNQYYNDDSKHHIPSERVARIRDNTVFSLRTLNDMRSFLRRIPDKSDGTSMPDDNYLLSDYKKYIDRRIEAEAFDNSWDDWKNNKEKYETALCSHIGQWRFFEACGAGSIHCENNSGTWSSYEIYSNTLTAEEDPEAIHYCFRYGYRKNKKAVFLQQYRWEKGVTNKNAKDDRETEFNELSIKLDALYADKKHGVICNFKNRQKGFDGKEIFRIVFDENDNTPEKVAEFIKSFTDEFKGIIEEIRSVMTAAYLPKNLETIPRTCLGSRDRSLHETS